MTNRLLGKTMPTTKDFSDAWKNILFSHFHDSLGGCSARAVYDDEDIFLKQSRGMAQKTINSALQTLSWNIDTSDEEKGVPDAAAALAGAKDIIAEEISDKFFKKRKKVLAFSGTLCYYTLAR